MRGGRIIRKSIYNILVILVLVIICVGLTVFTSCTEITPVEIDGGNLNSSNNDNTSDDEVSTTEAPAEPDYITDGPKTVDIKTYGNFETAGINIELDRITEKTTGEIYYKKQGDVNWSEGHRFTKYDNLHMASSLFYLENETEYDIKIIIKENGKYSDIQQTSVITKKEFELPEGKKIIEVSDNTEFVKAVANARPGVEIRLAPGDYEGFIIKVPASEDNPIIITSQTAEKPVINGQVQITGSEFIILNNLEITSYGTNISTNGLRITDSRYITVANCYIHDSGNSDTSNILISAGKSKKITEAHHLIINNVISDDYCEVEPAWNSHSPDKTYYGINISGHSGGMITIRGNIFYGLFDGIHSGESEKTAPTHYDAEADDMIVDDFLGTWFSQELDFYDNIMYNFNDDAIETDGHAVNARFFRNVISDALVAVSVAATYPGPVFFIENQCSELRSMSVKFNTGTVNRNVELTKNVYFYNNTFIQERGNGDRKSSVLWLMNAKVRNAFFLNNIIVSEDRILETDTSDAEALYDNFIMDYNVYYSFRNPNDGSDVLAKVLNGTKVSDGFSRYNTFEDYRDRNFNCQDMNSLYGDPMINYNRHAQSTEVTKIYDLIPDAESLVINAGVYIPGITGSKPNIGADQSYNTGGSAPYCLAEFPDYFTKE